MSDQPIVAILIEAQTKCYDALTGHIYELVTSYDNYDDIIKMLLDERRQVHDEFAKRIDAVKASS